MGGRREPERESCMIVACVCASLPPLLVSKSGRGRREEVALSRERRAPFDRPTAAAATAVSMRAT